MTTDLSSLLAASAKKKTEPQQSASPQSLSAKDKLKASLGKKPKFNLAPKPKTENTEPGETAIASSPPPSEPPQALDARPSVGVALDTAPVDATPTISAEEFQHESQPDGFDPAAVEELKKRLAFLQESFAPGLKEQISQAIRRVMTHVQEHRFLSDMLLPEDWGQMTRGLRQSYGVTIAKKTERKTKRAAKEEEVDRIADSLAHLDFGDI